MIYVLSDIHGNERRFNSILEQISLQPEDTLYILGDVIDRHPDGIPILRRLMAMPNAKMLLGNHEYMMLRALGHPYDSNVDTGTALAHWYRNGGQVTHDDFGRLSNSQQRGIIEYLLSLPLYYDIEAGGIRCKLVHAAPEECFDGDPKYHNPIHYAVWKRWDSFEDYSVEETLVFGHTPTRHYQDNVPMEIWQGERWIGIDCGSGYPEEGAPHSKYGRLACLRLDDGHRFYSAEKEYTE